MSEPTYRIELSHHPEDNIAVEWHGEVYPVADDDSWPLFHSYGSTREEAFNKAQAWAKAKAQEPHAPSMVFLTEDGDIHDPFDNAPVVRRFT